LDVVLDELAVVQQETGVLVCRDAEMESARRADVQVLRQPGAVQNRRAPRALLEDVRRHLTALGCPELALRLLEPRHDREDSFPFATPPASAAAEGLRSSPAPPRSAAPSRAPGRRLAGTSPRSSGTATGSP